MGGHVNASLMLVTSMEISNISIHAHFKCWTSLANFNQLMLLEISLCCYFEQGILRPEASGLRLLFWYSFLNLEVHHHMCHWRSEIIRAHQSLCPPYATHLAPPTLAPSPFLTSMLPCKQAGSDSGVQHVSRGLFIKPLTFHIRV